MKHELKEFRFTDRVPDGRKIEGLCFRSIVIRETDGLDEENAAEFAKAKGGRVSMQEELCKLAIVMVDDHEVARPFNDYDHWPTKSRDLVLRTFSMINGTTKDLADDFFEGGHAPDAAATVDKTREEIAKGKKGTSPTP